RAGYNSLAEQDGKLVRGVSRIDSIFGIAFGALGVGIMLVGLFVFIYSFALSSQLSARSVIFGIIIGLVAILMGVTATGIYAIPVLRAWQFQKWIPEPKTGNDKQMFLPFDQQRLASHLPESLEKDASEVRNKDGISNFKTDKVLKTTI